MKNDKNTQLLKNFGMRIKELRDDKGMSQEDLADAANIFRTYLSRIETGVANPSLTVINGLAAALREPVNSLMQAPSRADVPAKTFSRTTISRGRVER